MTRTLDSPEMTRSNLEPGSGHLTQEGDTVRLRLDGRFDADTLQTPWSIVLKEVQAKSPSKLVVDASGITYCDSAGLSLFVQLRKMQHDQGGEFTIEGLDERLQKLLDMYPAETFNDGMPPRKSLGLIYELGSGLDETIKSGVRFIAFLGELLYEVTRLLLRPHQFKFKEFAHILETAGMNAFGIIALLGFLIGAILAFQSAGPLSEFGAEIWVASMVSLSLFRELGPLITSIIVAGRTASSFAAELGTMQVREEINALHTMGLSPMRFLVVSRALGGMLATPLLTLFMNFFGLLGAAMVMYALGYPFVTFANEVLTWTENWDLMQGLIKAVVFGFVVAAIGCEEGINTSGGPSAVGEATTSTVVRSIILVIVLDGIFATVFFTLGW